MLVGSTSEYAVRIYGDWGTGKTTLQPALKDAGFDISVATIYRDLTSLNQKNTFIRDLTESNYSRYQEQITESFDWIEQKTREQFESTENHIFLNVIAKVHEFHYFSS